MLRSLFMSIAFTATLFFAVTTQADIITVTATGQVVFNAIGAPPLSTVFGGDTVEVSFTIDSNNFVDSIPGDIRAYEIVQASFSINFSTPVEMGLLSPYPGGFLPYFGVIDGFPVSDGFFVADSTVSPGGVQLEQSPFNMNLSLGYEGSTLSSTDILDAIGVYDFTGLTSFGFNLWSISPDNVAMEMDFQQMTIAGDSSIPEPASILFLAPLAGVTLIRRRR